MGLEGALGNRPFGESLVDNATAQKFAKGFTGHVQTGASGIIDMQYRKMLPTWGRFTSPDPGWDQNPEDPQSWNLNSYVRGNPVMNVDPDGRFELGLLGPVIKFEARLLANWMAGAPKAGAANGSSNPSIESRMGLPLKTTEANSFERGGTLRMDLLTPEMRKSAESFKENVEGEGGVLSIQSAYRPAEYQEHLQKVWDLSKDSGALTSPEKAKVEKEKKKHGLVARPAGSAGKHTKGEAIDAKWSGISDADALEAASKAGLKRPYPKKDPVHFERNTTK